MTRPSQKSTKRANLPSWKSIVEIVRISEPKSSGVLVTKVTASLSLQMIFLAEDAPPVHLGM